MKNNYFPYARFSHCFIMFVLFPVSLSCACMCVCVCVCVYISCVYKCLVYDYLYMCINICA